MNVEIGKCSNCGGRIYIHADTLMKNKKTVVKCSRCEGEVDNPPVFIVNKLKRKEK